MNTDGLKEVMDIAKSATIVDITNAEWAITRVLENTLHDLESLRACIEAAGEKAIHDVRGFSLPSYSAPSLLRGIEQPVTYPFLLTLIEQFKTGLARRRLSLQS